MEDGEIETDIAEVSRAIFNFFITSRADNIFLVGSHFKVDRSIRDRNFIFVVEFSIDTFDSGQFGNITIRQDTKLDLLTIRLNINKEEQV